MTVAEAQIVKYLMSSTCTNKTVMSLDIETHDSLICGQYTTFKVIVVSHNIKFAAQLCD